MSTPFLGQITMFGGSFAPRGWALCQGQLLAISSFQSLFSLLGTTYGGDGRTTFGLPDLRGRSAIHPGTSGSSGGINLGNKVGDESVILNTNQIPAHTHSAMMRANTGPPDVTDMTAMTDGTLPTGHVLAMAPFYQDQAPNSDMNAGAVTVSSTGGSGHDNMQPFLTINYIIALQGVFPSRN
jgi:microcystin-dependent protein